MKLHKHLKELTKIQEKQYIELINLAYEKSNLVFQWSCNQTLSYIRLKELLDNYPEDYTLLFLILDTLSKSTFSLWDQIQSFCLRGLKLFPDDGAFQKFYGDFLRFTVGMEQAQPQYLRALELSRNGFFRLEIDQTLREGAQ